MTLSAEDLERVIRTVWSTQLGFDLEAGAADVLSSCLGDDESFETVLTFSGEFNGRFEQCCSSHVALSAAAAAFAGTTKELHPGDVRDVVAEMAHMTAGNLKSLLPGSCNVDVVVSAASSGEGSESTIATAAFTFEGKPLVVQVIEVG